MSCTKSSDFSASSVILPVEHRPQLWKVALAVAILRRKPPGCEKDFVRDLARQVNRREAEGEKRCRELQAEVIALQQMSTVQKLSSLVPGLLLERCSAAGPEPLRYPVVTEDELPSGVRRSLEGHRFFLDSYLAIASRRPPTHVSVSQEERRQEADLLSRCADDLFALALRMQHLHPVDRRLCVEALSIVASLCDSHHLCSQELHKAATDFAAKLVQDHVGHGQPFQHEQQRCFLECLGALSGSCTLRTPLASRLVRRLVRNLVPPSAERTAVLPDQTFLLVRATDTVLSRCREPPSDADGFWEGIRILRGLVVTLRESCPLLASYILNLCLRAEEMGPVKC